MRASAAALVATLVMTLIVIILRLFGCRVRLGSRLLVLLRICAHAADREAQDADGRQKAATARSQTHRI